MIVKKGDKVQLVHTREVGVVEDYIDANMVLISLDGHNIPVFLDDLQFVQQDNELPPMHIKRSREICNLMPYDHENPGIFLALQPERDRQDQIQEFTGYIINNLNKEILSDLSFQLSKRDIYRSKRELKPYHFYPLNKFQFDELNENPSFTVKLWPRQKEEGKESFFELLIRLKPQTFFKTLKEVPLMDTEAYLFKIIEAFPEKKINSSKSNDLKNLQQKFSSKVRPEKRMNDVLQKASIKHEIDLHIEKLVKDHSKYTSGEILNIQLHRCERYLQQALMYGLDRVYLIHGVGKGKLREEIFALLKSYPHVKTFSNIYHPRYGYGATEVVFE